MITFLLITLSLLILAGFTALFHAFHHTADGYEDETGFHEGLEPLPAGVTRLPSSEPADDHWTPVPQRGIPEPIAHHGTAAVFK